MVGGLLIGVIEAFVGGSQFSNYRDAIAFVILIVILLFRPSGLFYAFWFPVSGVALIGGGLSRRRRWLMAIALTAVMSGIALQAGCSNTSNTSTTTGTPAGTYTIPINATSGSATRTTAVTLIVK